MTISPSTPQQVHRRISAPALRRRLARPLEASRPALPLLLAIGTATPDLGWPQEQIRDAMAELWDLRGAALERWRRIIAGSGIEHRCGVLPVDQVIAQSTARRMELYEQFAPGLAAQAAAIALREAAVNAARITDLIVVSCTGFSAPGVDVALVQRLGLRPTVRRCTIGFMGCFGAITGLRAAAAACAADANAVVLMVSVELCSLHISADCDPQNQVASALFADGAAAAVVAGADVGGGGGATARDDTQVEPLGRIAPGASLLLPHGRDWMTWRITDYGFAMTLAREVPTALRAALGEFVAGVARPEGQPWRSFAVHPGGPGVLDAADAALALEGGHGLESARAILRHFGNMSSATILFVLREMLARDLPLPALLLAFGPGLTIESIALAPAQPDRLPLSHAHIPLE